MPDIAQLFIAKAWAQAADAPAAAPATAGSTAMSFLPLLLILVVFYFLLIRPQQKKLEAQEAMVKALKKGDEVITNGGFVGTVASLDDDYAMLKIAEGVQVKIVRSTIAGLAADAKKKKG
jgi:preprotein translocase subunit YajC